MIGGYTFRNGNLPVLEEICWEGFAMDEQAEADVSNEHRALHRLGWTENRWRQCPSLLQAELQCRNRWWELVQQYTERWNGDMSGQTPAQEALSMMFSEEELARRLAWNIYLRQDGYGLAPQISWDYVKPHYRRYITQSTFDDSDERADGFSDFSYF